MHSIVNQAKPSRVSANKRVRNRAVLERIKNAAFELFSERGYDRTSVDDIAERAGISRRTFFRYCPSKAEALWADTKSRLLDFQEHLEKSPKNRPLLDVILEAYLEAVFNNDIRFVRARLQQLHDTPHTAALRWTIYAQYEGAIAGFVAERSGQSPNGTFPRMLAHCVIAAIRAANLAWLGDDGRRDWKDYVTETFEYLRHGFVSAKRPTTLVPD
jgi:AcrR family transcriptional regulator